MNTNNQNILYYILDIFYQYISDAYDQWNDENDDDVDNSVLAVTMLYHLE